VRLSRPLLSILDEGAPGPEEAVENGQEQKGLVPTSTPLSSHLPLISWPWSRRVTTDSPFSIRRSAISLLTLEESVSCTTECAATETPPVRGQALEAPRRSLRRRQ